MNQNVVRRTLTFCLVAGAVLFVASPAFATMGTSTMGAGVTNMADQIVQFLTGRLMLAIASIMFIVALVGAYFSGGNDAAKKALTVLAITAAIFAAPGIIQEVVNATGAMIA